MNDTFKIETLGPARIKSPINLGTEKGDLLADFVPDDSRVVTEVALEKIMEYVNDGQQPPSMELAGPRQNIYFDASKLKVGIVTCGGLCPGLNDVIRGLVMALHYGYGVAAIFGFKYGLPRDVDFVFDAGVENAGDQYFLMCGISGTWPGKTLPGGLVVPCNWDPIVMPLVRSLNNIAIFFDFIGTLDGLGQASPRFEWPGYPGSAGLKIYFAGCTIYPFDFVTNAVQVEVE